MTVGLFFGSFNPIHTGHLLIANHVLNETSLSQIWFVVSPQNPFKQNSELLDAAERLQLVKLAVKDDTRLFASDVEFQLSLPSYTVNTLHYLETNFPDINFTLILGSDTFLQLDKWKDADTLFKKNILVYQRPGYVVPQTGHSPNISVLISPLLEISATEIRRLIKAGKSIRYLVPISVENEIENNKLYR